MSETEVIETEAVEAVETADTDTPTIAQTETDTPDGESGTDSEGERPRDAQGRFIARESTATTPAPTPGEGTQSETTAQATSTTPPTQPGSAPTGEVQTKPYTVKVEGQEYGIEGASYSPDGNLVIPAASVANVTRAIQEGIYKQLHWEAHLESERSKSHEAGKNEGRAVSDKILDVVAGMAAKVRSGDRNQVAEVLQWFIDYESALPRYQAEAERDQYKARVEAIEAGKKREADARESETLGQQKDAAIEAQLAEFRQHPDTKLLTDADWTAIKGQWARLKDSFFVQQDGVWHIDPSKMAVFVEDRIQIRRDVAEQQKQLATAVNHNKRNVPGKPGAPPAVPATQVSTPASATKQYKTRQEWERDHGIA